MNTLYFEKLSQFDRVAEPVASSFQHARLEAVDEQEHPAVAAARYARLFSLALRIHEKCTEQLLGAALPMSRPMSFAERKTSWDVLNKWVFWSVASRAQEAAAPGSPDAVIPSDGSAEVRRTAKSGLPIQTTGPGGPLATVSAEHIHRVSIVGASVVRRASVRIDSHGGVET